MATINDIKVDVNYDKLILEFFKESALHFYKKTGVVVESIDFKWGDCSTMSETNKVLLGVQMKSTL